MSQTYQIPNSTALSNPENKSVPAGNPVETPLASRLAAANPAVELTMHLGTRTPVRLSSSGDEWQALLRHAGVFDLGYRSWLRATGKDRVRWMNGMITQAAKSMSPGQTGYTLVLNPQGRIQGDASLLAYDDRLLLETDRSQTERLLGHLRRFIIMDDVRLEELDAATTAIGIAGPQAAAILEKLGAVVPAPDSFCAAQLVGIGVTLVRVWSPVVTKVEIWVPAERVLELWNALVDAGATPCGVAATEDLRILEGIPRFDVDFNDKHLPQEANLQRALNFTKGCYIGQEIVERIRSRATVHRSLRQFELQGEIPKAAPGEKIELLAGDAVVGELTSVAQLDLPALTKTLALGVARAEALEKSGSEPIRYEGGIAVPLTEPPIRPTI